MTKDAYDIAHENDIICFLCLALMVLWTPFTREKEFMGYFFLELTKGATTTL